MFLGQFVWRVFFTEMLLLFLFIESFLISDLVIWEFLNLGCNISSDGLNMICTTTV